MAHPKRRHSKARKKKRRAHDSLTSISVSKCPQCHNDKLPHRACVHCGYYKGKEVVEVKEV